ncbi:Uncharacterised protein [Sebaldella termitidis]|uniref:Uncharacterized protein n=1 Tax=Sebaldella termitidis (strain ATCC 33386 / NCTC 11300) TaxID=526218 RepID=D1AR09_SEBTE|nr:hypothetical protein [Sebaldella termitidis]ACZ07697.1 hypothetical protein Sterm_0825 [Sebaldella termitidis ATCC 33386]SUI22993.1 Uncharacterised protein [Sebaldella termitidis]
MEELNKLRTENECLKEKINSLEKELQDYRVAVFGILNPIQNSINELLVEVVPKEKLFKKTT